MGSKLYLRLHGDQVLVKSIKKAFSKGSFLRNTAYLFSGNFPGHLLGLLMTPVVTRLYSPEDIGVAGLVLVWVSLASTLTSLKYELAVVAETSQVDSLYLLKVCLWIAFPLSVLCTLGGTVFIFTESFGYGELPLISTLLIFVLIYLTTQNNTLKYWFIRNETYGPISQQVLILNFSRAGFWVALGVWKAHWWSYLLSEAFARGLSLYPVCRGRVIEVLKTSTRSLRDSLSLLKKHKNFPLMTVPSSFLDNLALSLPTPFIAHHFGVEATGFYVLVHRMVLGTSSILGGVVADTFHGRMAKYSRENPSHSFTFFKRTSALLAALGVGPVVLLILWGPELFALVFGKNWYKAGEMAQIVAPWAFFQLVVSPVSRIVVLFDWQKSKLIYDVTVLILTLSVFGHSTYNQTPIGEVVGLITGVNVVCYVGYFIVLWWRLKRQQLTF